MLSQEQAYKPEPTNQAAQEQQAIRQYLPLVKRTVSRLRSHCGSVLVAEDMEQIGLMALLDAVRRYPGERDNGFISFAAQRIRGAILDEMRRLDWRPRQVRQAAHEHNDAVRALTRQLGRPPTEPEVAQHLGLTAEELRQRHYDCQAESMLSLDELLQGGSPGASNDEVQSFVDRRTLKAALAQLNQRQQLVIALYYQQELNLKEIALTLGVTEARACQLHKASIKALQALLAEMIN